MENRLKVLNRHPRDLRKRMIQIPMRKYSLNLVIPIIWLKEKDGLIFTPTNTGVGGFREPLKSKFTWQESFKWKPPRSNTIDFLVKIKKNEIGDITKHKIGVS